jgi:cytochrome c peroxidase
VTARRPRRHERSAAAVASLWVVALVVTHAGRASATTPPPAPGYASPEFEVPRPGSYSLPPLGKAADANVLDSNGAKTTLYDAFGDDVAVLAFVYTNCAEAGGCPLAHFVMRKAAQEALDRDDLRGRVRFVSLSFDPVRDTPAEMAKMSAMAPRGAAWKFLTTANEGEIRPILSAYGQSIARERDASGHTTSQISHVLRVFLVDADKVIRNIYSSAFLHSGTLLADVETLLMERRVSPGGTARASDASAVADLLANMKRPGLGLPPIPVPENDQPTAAKIALGRKLFYDRRLSRNATFSCAMCHVPTQGFTSNEMATAVGIEGRTVRRNAPTIYNVAYAVHLFHDARESRLEQQVWGPLLAVNEMGNPSVGFVIDRILESADYDGLFEAAFEGRRAGMETIGMALAAYERTLVSGGSPFDRWRYGGDETAVSPEAKHGFEVFTGKGGCAACHLVGEPYALFTDQSLHDTGVGYRDPHDPAPARPRMQVAPGEFVELHPDAGALPAPNADLGRYEITEDPADRWKFKTPTLRNVALTAPYMHDGSLQTLAAVVDYYDGGGRPHDGLDPRVRRLGLSAEEKAALVRFLESLSGENVQMLVADAISAPIGDPR